MKHILLAALLLAGNICYAQIKAVPLDSTTTPASIHYKGTVVNSLRWKDKLGDNVVILTEWAVGVDSNDARGNELFAYHYVLGNDSAKLAWRIVDGVEDCDLDMTSEFVDSAFAVTDLDNNGIAEVWIMYKVACYGDVSPLPMKIIMYEGNKKFAMRGGTKVRVNATDYIGGEFTFDDNFNTGPALFRQYADRLWQRHKVETYGHKE